MRARFAASCVALVISGVAGPVQGATGGPDPAGYVYSDSASSGGPSYAFENIAASGTPIAFDSYGNALLSLPFPFTLYGRTLTQLYANGNGFLSPDYIYYGSYNTTLPTTWAPNSLIAGMWGNLTWYYGGLFRSQTLGTAPTRRFIVQFSTGACPYACSTATFQFKLFETTNVVEIHYETAPGGGLYGYTHTIGIEDQDGRIGLQYRYGNAALPTPIAVRFVQVLPPSIPQVTLPESARVGAAVPLTAVSSDPGAHDIAYTIDWGDGSKATRIPSSGFTTHNAPILASHVYTSVGTYAVVVRATNRPGLGSPPFTSALEITNAPPGRARTPSGPSLGLSLFDVEFATSAEDPDGDALAYFFDWGDGSAPERVPAAGRMPSGQTVTAHHRYAAAGTFAVRAWAQDPYGSDGPVSDPATVQVLL